MFMIRTIIDIGLIFFFVVSYFVIFFVKLIGVVLGKNMER